MYKLTTEPNVVQLMATGECFGEGSPAWGLYQSWLQRGNSPIEADDHSQANARAKRDGLLRYSDWTQMDDAPLTPAKKLEWAAYRKLLRDLPTVVGFPNVPWPQPPANTDGAADGVPGQFEPIPD